MDPLITLMRELLRFNSAWGWSPLSQFAGSTHICLFVYHVAQAGLRLTVHQKKTLNISPSRFHFAKITDVCQHTFCWVRLSPGQTEFWDPPTSASQVPSIAPAVGNIKEQIQGFGCAREVLYNWAAPDPGIWHIWWHLFTIIIYLLQSYLQDRHIFQLGLQAHGLLALLW